MFLKPKTKNVSTLVFIKEDLNISLKTLNEKKKSFSILSYLLNCLSRL